MMEKKSGVFYSEGKKEYEDFQRDRESVIAQFYKDTAETEALEQDKNYAPADVQVTDTLCEKFLTYFADDTKTVLITEGKKFRGQLGKIIAARPQLQYTVTVRDEEEEVIVKSETKEDSRVSIVKANIYEYGAVSGNYDLILSIPDYGVKDYVTGAGNLMCREMELKALENLLYHLTDTGRLAVLVPLRLAYVGNMPTKLRAKILEQYSLKSYVEVSEGMLEGSRLDMHLYEIGAGQTENIHVSKGHVYNRELIVDKKLSISKEDLCKVGRWIFDLVLAYKEGRDWNLSPEFQAVRTTPIPESYYQEAEHRGTIERFEYDTYAYAGDGRKIRKPAMVYLPYGYDNSDREKKYNVLYLMHGWTGYSEFYMEYNDGMLRKMLDHMIENGEIKPIICVMPTFDADNKAKGFGESMREVHRFYEEFRKDLVISLETHYSTYLESPDEAGAAESREHRAFSGESLGAATTWSVFLHDVDLVKYFVPTIGDCQELVAFGGLYKPHETVQALVDAVKRAGLGWEDFYIFLGDGTEDSVFTQVAKQVEAMKSREEFTEKNFSYRLKPYGKHDCATTFEALYNALPEFFT